MKAPRVAIGVVSRVQANAQPQDRQLGSGAVPMQWIARAGTKPLAQQACRTARSGAVAGCVVPWPTDIGPVAACGYRVGTALVAWAGCRSGSMASRCGVARAHGTRTRGMLCRLPGPTQAAYAGIFHWAQTTDMGIQIRADRARSVRRQPHRSPILPMPRARHAGSTPWLACCGCTAWVAIGDRTVGPAGCQNGRRHWPKCARRVASGPWHRPVPMWVPDRRLRRARTIAFLPSRVSRSST